MHCANVSHFTGSFELALVRACRVYDADMNSVMFGDVCLPLHALEAFSKLFLILFARIVTVKESSKIAANVTFIVFTFYLSKKIRLGVSCESSS